LACVVFDFSCLTLWQDPNPQANLFLHLNPQPCGTAVIQIHAGRGFDLPYVSTAFGDAGGKVFEIESGGIRVGFELEFLAPGYTYDEYG